MRAGVHSFLLREGVAFLSVAVATAATWATWPNLEPTVTPFFLAAVTISGWLGGLRGGLIAAILSTIASLVLSAMLGWSGELGFASATWTASFLLVALLTGALNSARRNAEQLLIERDSRMRLVSDQIPAALWSTDTELRLTSLFGSELALVTPHSQVITLNDVFESKTRHAGASVEEAHRRALLGEAGSYEIDLRGRVYQCHVEPLHDPEGSIIGVVGVALDITERKRAEVQLEQARDEAKRLKQEAEAANHAKDRFLAMLSHELRTPLTPALLAATELEERGNLPASAMENLAMIRRNIEVEATLIDDLLDLTRVARGKMEMSLRATNLHGVLERSIEICRQDFNEKRIELITDLSAGPNLVMADPARLQQVFWNLIKNAVKFNRPGGRVAIRTMNLPGSSPDEAPTIAVEVSDTGIGIEPQFLPKVFDAFEQGAPAITREFGGLGLGLAITKALVEAHRGQLRAESPGRDRGATFRVEMQTVREPVESPVRSEPPGSRSEHKSVKILLVEDHIDTRRVMSSVLAGMGHKVRSAGTLAAAIQSLQNEPFEVLVSDISLPDGSGLDLMRHVRQANGKMSVHGIALSGLSMADDIRQCYDAGFEKHLAKPVNLRQLQETIQELAASSDVACQS